MSIGNYSKASNQFLLVYFMFSYLLPAILRINQVSYQGESPGWSNMVQLET